MSARELCRAIVLHALHATGSRLQTFDPLSEPRHALRPVPPSAGRAAASSARSRPRRPHRRRRSSASRSPASARTQLPIAIAALPRRGQVAAAGVGHRARRPRAQRPVPHRRRAGAASTKAAAPSMPEWRAPRRRRAGGGLGVAPGRRPLRRALQALGRGQGRANCGGQSNAVVPADLRLAAHRIADSIYEKLTGEQGRVLHPHRLRHARRRAATRCASPMPTAKAGRSR